MPALHAACIDADDREPDERRVVGQFAQRRQRISAVDREHRDRAAAELVRKQRRIDAELDARRAQQRHRAGRIPDAIELHRPQVGVVLHGDEVAALAQQPFVPDGEQRAHQQRGDPGMQPLSIHRQNWK